MTSDEKKKLTERGTDNAEAYELFLKATEYFELQTKEGWEIAAQLYTQAIELDPNYAEAYSGSANMHAVLFRNYDRNPERLTNGEALCKEALRLKPGLLGVYHSLMSIYLLQGNLAEAEGAAREFIRLAPNFWQGYGSLGFFYQNSGNPEKAIPPLEEAVRLKPDHLVSLFNLVVACAAVKDWEKCAFWSLKAIPFEERRLKLHPDDETSRMRYAYFLLRARKLDEARAQAEKLKNARDGFPLYNTACLFVELGDDREGLRIFRRAIEAGYRFSRGLKGFLTDPDGGIPHLAGTPEYEEVQRIVEEILGESLQQNHA